MKNDKKIIVEMKKLAELSKDWTEYVKCFGKCAASDRELEEIVALASNIKKLYDGNK